MGQLSKAAWPTTAGDPARHLEGDEVVQLLQFLSIVEQVAQCGGQRQTQRVLRVEGCVRDRA